MSTSHYFNNFNNSMEKQLVEDLVVESIRIYGNDVYYCPRRVMKLDEIYGEDVVSEYKEAFIVETYIKSVDGFEGDGMFLSKFGLEVRDQITLSIAKRTFNEEIGSNIGTIRPGEGDLIYFTLNPDRPQLYVIKYVNDRSIFYQIGGLQVYDLVCEVFEYSSEKLNTGIAAIDILEAKNSISLTNYSLLTQDGLYITDQSGFDIIQGQFDLETQTKDYGEDNFEIQTEAAVFIDWSETDPFSEGSV